MPRLTGTRFALAVPDLARSTDWYTKVLGLQVDFTVPGWSFLSRDAFSVMLGECPDATPAGQLGDHSYYGYITVDDAAALAAECQASGAEFIQPLTDKPWGMREFGVRTLDGHRIMFGQPLGRGVDDLADQSASKHVADAGRNQA